MKPGYVLPAAGLPAGTVITMAAPTTLVSQGDVTVLTKTDRPGRCPWRIGGPRSARYAANWRAQELIRDGAQVVEPRPTVPPVLTRKHPPRTFGQDNDGPVWSNHDGPAAADDPGAARLPGTGE